MTKIDSRAFSFQQLLNQAEKLLGLKLLRQINKYSYILCKFLCSLTSLVSFSFRQKKAILIEKLNDLSTSECYYYDRKLYNAVIAIEDKRFLLHCGHDLPSIIRAILNNIRTKRIQGASTVEQQLVRIILNERAVTFKRKYFEILLSAQVYKMISKQQIINIYLDNYNFSKSIIGLESFCKKEGYNVQKLSDKDVFEIIARIKYPAINNKNYLHYLKRVRTIEILNSTNHHWS